MPKLHIEITCEGCKELYLTNEQGLAIDKRCNIPHLCKKCRIPLNKKKAKARDDKFHNRPVYIKLSFKEMYEKRNNKKLNICQNT